MTAETIEALRQLLFWLNEHIPMLHELWMYLLNYLANYG